MAVRIPEFYWTTHARQRWAERVSKQPPVPHDAKMARRLRRSELKKMRRHWPPKYRDMAASVFFTYEFRLRTIQGVGDICFVTKKKPNGQRSVVTVLVLRRELS